MEQRSARRRAADWAQWSTDNITRSYVTDVRPDSRRKIFTKVTRTQSRRCGRRGGLGADVISAYSAYNFLMPGYRIITAIRMAAWIRQMNCTSASFPGAMRETAAASSRDHSRSVQGEYSLANSTITGSGSNSIDPPQSTGADEVPAP